ncbi:hypothetical protein [Salinifilum ghardaiensis]
MTDALSLTQLRDAVDRTVAAGAARVTLHLDFAQNRAKFDAAVPRRRGILPALTRAIIRRLPKGLDAEGFLDLAGRRAMFDEGRLALLQLEDRVWTGRPGRTLDSLDAEAPPQFVTPLWLFDTLTDVTALEDHGVDDDPTRPWRHITARTTAQGNDETVEVWLDDTHIRRLRLGRDTTTMTLDEFGVDADELDWTRLPSYQANAGTS